MHTLWVRQTYTYNGDTGLDNVRNLTLSLMAKAVKTQSELFHTITPTNRIIRIDQSTMFPKTVNRQHICFEGGNVKYDADHS